MAHELTALPTRLDPRDKRAYEATNRIRRDRTANLLAAARAVGARRFICQSIAFAYAPGPRPQVKAEDAPLFLTAPPPFGDGVRVIAEMERAVLEADGIDALVLRYGWFYGPGTYFGRDGATAADVRRRRFPVIGKGPGPFSFFHVDNAGSRDRRVRGARRSGCLQLRREPSRPRSADEIPALTLRCGQHERARQEPFPSAEIRRRFTRLAIHDFGRSVRRGWAGDRAQACCTISVALAALSDAGSARPRRAAAAARSGPTRSRAWSSAHPCVSVRG